MDFNINFQEFDQYGLCPQPEDGVDLFVSVNLNKDEALPIQQQTVFSNVINDDQIFESVMSDCKVISEKLNIHPYIAFMILESQNWNTHLVYENWATMHDSMLLELGVKLSNANEDPSLRHPNVPADQEIECEVCYGTFPVKDMWCLPCGHSFCRDCWKEHVTVHIASGQHLINCQADGCKRKLPPNSVEQLCGKKVYNDFLRYLMDTTVSLSDTLTNCPNPKCSKPVNVLSTGLCNILKCSCRYEFCSLCREPSHAPANCVERTFWLSITSDDLMKKRLLGPNCKICPNCKSTIEKNGGCNHMTCTHCHHEFCWMCGKEWKTHPQTFYECAAYKPEEDPYLKKPDNISRELLEPYHDKFIHKGADNKVFLDKINQNTDYLIQKRIHHEPGLTDPEKKQAITDLLNEIYWARENLRWSQVHLFNLRYQVVKNAETKDQTNEQMYPNTKKFNIFKFVLSDTEANIDNIVKDLLDEQKSKIMFHDISKINKGIHLLRDSLLKHCDPHYSENS